MPERTVHKRLTANHTDTDQEVPHKTDCNKKKSKNTECMIQFSSYAHENGLKEKLFAFLPRKSVCDLYVNVCGCTSGGECVCVLQCKCCSCCSCVCTRTQLLRATLRLLDSKRRSVMDVTGGRRVVLGESYLLRA